MPDIYDPGTAQSKYFYIKTPLKGFDRSFASVLDYVKKKNSIKSGLKYDLYNFIDKNELAWLFYGATISAAEADSTLRASVSGFYEIKTVKDLYFYKPAFNRIYDLDLSDNAHEESSPPTVFFKRGETAVEIFQSPEESDIYGNKCDKEELTGIDYDPRSFTETRSSKTVYYTAAVDGYLAMDGNRITLCRPVKNTENNTKMKMIFFPVINDENIVIDFFYKTYQDFSEKNPGAPVQYLLRRDQFQLPGTIVVEKIISFGIAPVHGRDAEIIILAVPERTDNTEETTATDYREIKNYVEVKEGDILLEKNNYKEGSDGKDVFGNKIDVVKGRDISVRHDENILEEQKEDKIYYKAAITGIFKYEKKYASISRTMIVEGDLDFSVGNIDFENSVIIKGNVLSSFSIKAGEDVAIEGSVENNVIIHCEGSLTVLDGIIGEKTRIYAGGSISVKHVMEAGIYTEGNCVIRKNIIGGTVFSRKELIVKGIGIKSKSSCMFGGKYYSMKKIDTYSAGNANRPTFICCGYNPYSVISLKETCEAVAAAEQQIIQIMKRLGSRITGENYREAVAAMNQGEKERLKENLLKLKTVSARRESLQEKKSFLESDIYADVSDNPSIIIKKFLYPVVECRIINSKKTFTSQTGAIIIDVKSI